jgi:hypothetical protein
MKTPVSAAAVCSIDSLEATQAGCAGFRQLTILRTGNTIRQRHSVSVLCLRAIDTIFGFEKEADERRWIEEKSRAWPLE